MFNRTRITSRSAVVFTLSLAAVFWLGMTIHAATAQPPASKSVQAKASPGATALETAAKNNKYLFIFFFDKEDSHTNAMKAVLQAAIAKMSARAESTTIDIADPAEKPIVDKFGARGAPMPVVLAVAPTGAATKAFPKQFDEAQLQEAFVSPCTAKCMRAIQDRHSVLLCVQNGKTQSNKEAMQGVEAFKNDPQYTKGIEVIMLDPADKAEQDFLKDLQVDPKTTTAVTLLVMPPGAPVARFTGALTKDEIETAVKAAQSSCGPGCNCH
jgi:hypothetical protein